MIVKTNRELAELVKEVIYSTGDNQNEIAKKMEMTRQGVSHKLSKVYFNIEDAVSLLDPIGYQVDVKVTNKDKPSAYRVMKVDNLPNEDIKDLWLEFGDVPMDPETEEIECDWNIFKAGTHKEEIWHWFEGEFDIVIGEMFNGVDDYFANLDNTLQRKHGKTRGTAKEIWNVFQKYLDMCNLDNDTQDYIYDSKYEIQEEIEGILVDYIDE